MRQQTHRVAAVAGALLGLVPGLSLAQQGITITGTVTTEAALPLQGAQVSIPSLGVGAYADEAGHYTFRVAQSRAGQTVNVTARRIGYTAKTVSVTLNGTTITENFSLGATATQLTGVVVTALGQTVEKSQLGTAQQQISSEQLTTTFSPNIENQLQGKVSGVSIVGNGTQGGSTNITIRGYTSISGNNQPLFVIDGVAIANNDRGSQQQGGGITGSKDFGNVIQDINPDDVASISVLKGPNAAALYGSRAANGAIIITTKRGGSRNTVVDFNSSLTFDRPAILPKFQNSYGQGSSGDFKWVDGLGALDGNDQSYGPRLDVPGRLIAQFNSPVVNGVPQPTPWVSHPNNIESFFNTGQTRDATLSVSGGTDRTNARLSLNGENVEGIIPNEFLRRLGGMVTGSLQANDRLTLNGSLDYTRNDGANRPGQGYVGGIVEGLYVWFGRQVDMQALKNNWMNSAALNGGPPSREFNWNYSYHNNPYFMQYADAESDQRDRVIANGSATYKVADWLTATLRSGTDTYRYNIGSNFAAGDIELNNGSTTVNPAYNGAFANIGEAFTENNTDVLLTANHDFTSHFALTGTFGGNRRYTTDNQSAVTVNGIIQPGIYNVANAGLPPVNQQAAANQAVNSAYGSGAFTYNGWWTVEATGRNDWSSTLPKTHNSYFYPSVNTSVVLSDALPALRNNSVVSYLKLRAGSARVGNDAPAYSLFTTFTGNSNKFGGLPLFTLSNTLLNPDLKPENTVSNEGGVEVGLWNNRVSLDASVYDKYTTDEITAVTLPPSSGYGTKLVNAGKIDNRGFEALLTFEPIKSARWNWSSTLNFSHNKGRVISLLAPITFGGFQGSVLTEARQGEPFGTFRGFAIKRNADGVPLLATDGTYQRTDTMVTLGSFQPDWTGGWFNQIRFNRFTLSATLDIRHGGKLFSGTNFYGQATGTLASTMMGREEDWDKPGVVINGIIEKTGQKNDINVTTEQYFQSLAYNNIAEPYVYDDSYIKFRELRVGYDLPPRLSNRLNANAVNIAFIGRNLFTHSNVPNVDPEITYNTGSNQGIEYAGLPAPRSLGFAVRITP